MLTKLIDCRQHSAHQVGLVDTIRHQEPVPYGWSRRAHANHFRIIADPKFLGQLSQPLVEYEFSIAMGFKIKRCRSDQLLLVPDG